MKFSFVVPIYNVEAYLERCIKSIIAQTYSDFEVILVDDGSTDSSLEICREYEKMDDRISVYSKENGGLSDARNYGLARASGEYVIFVDSDDYIDEKTCEMLLPLTELKPDIIQGNAIREGAGDGVLRRIYMEEGKVYKGSDYMKALALQNQMTMEAWLNICRREFLRDNALEFKKGILHEDEEFTPRLYLTAQRVVDARAVFYHYVIRENSIMTKKDKRKNARDMLGTALSYEKILDDFGDEQLKNRIMDLFVMKYLSTYQAGGLSKYGKEYLPKKFLLRNAHRRKTRLKAILVCISPKLYSFVHALDKKAKR